MAVKQNKRILPVPILGLDTSMPGSLIDARATPDCQNVRIERTQIKKKEGYRQLGVTLSGDVMLLGETDIEGTKHFFCITTLEFYWWNSGAAAWVNDTGSGINLGGVVTTPACWSTSKISGKNILVFTNYVDAIWKWTGDTDDIAALGGSPPIPKYLLGFDRYLLLGYIKDGADIYPERVQWCDYDDPETWTQGVATTAGYQDLDDGHPITGMFRLGNNACISKENSIWVGYLTNDDRIFQFEAVERRLGFLAGNTIKVIPGGVAIGLSKHGIVQFNGLSAQLIAPSIFEDIRDDVNPQQVHKSFANVVAELNEYHLYVPVSNGNYPTRVYKYNYLTKQVYRDTVTDLTAAGLWTNIQGTLIDDFTSTIDSYTGKFDDVIRSTFYPVIILGDKNGKTYEVDYDLENEDDVAINAYWCSQDIAVYPGYYSHWSELMIEAKGDAVTVSYSTDEGSTYTTLETVTLASAMAVYTIYCDIFAEKVRIKVTNSTASETFTLRNIYYKMPKMREATER